VRAHSAPGPSAFDLRLRAKRKFTKTIRIYVEAALWLAEYLLGAGVTDWADVTARHRPGRRLAVRQRAADGHGPFWPAEAGSQRTRAGWC
jgi:hypothetical protein